MNEKDLIKQINLTNIATELMTYVETKDGGKHPALHVSFDLIKTVLPQAEEYLKEYIEKKDADTSKTGEKLYTVANAGKNDVLKLTKQDGVFWGALKTEDGASKMVKLKEVATSNPDAAKAAAVSNPYVLMILVALTIIEKDIKKILVIEKQILSFLETEKESEVEADVKTLSSIMTKYTANQDNEKFVTSNHKLVLDIQRTARKNIIFYKKNIEKLSKDKSLTISQTGLEGLYKKFDKQFKYYKMSIFTFSLASFLEVLLSGNFEEENITIIKNEIDEVGGEYCVLHNQCSEKMKKISHNSIETNTVKGTGVFVGFAGKLFSKSKKEKNLERGEKLQNKGSDIVNKSKDLEEKIIKSFSETEDPETSLFLEKMEDMVFIFNRTGQICLDENGIYLVNNN